MIEMHKNMISDQKEHGLRYVNKSVKMQLPPSGADIIDRRET